MNSWLIAMRDERGLSQKSVAKAVGISQPSYCNIETGKHSPAIKTAKKIAEILGFDWTKFYEKKDDNDKKASSYK